MNYKVIEIKSRELVGEREILDCIIDCSELVTKHNIDKEKVKEYRKKVKDGVKFPNVELDDNLSRVRINEGNHRIQAHKEEGKYINTTLKRDLPEYHWYPHRFTKKNYDRVMNSIKKGREQQEKLKCDQK